MLSSTLRKCMSRPARQAAQRTRSIAAHMMSTEAGSEPPVTFHSRGNLRVFNLNRPTKLNALNEEMIDLIRPKVTQWSKSHICDIICSTGAGRGYCAGGDIVAVAQDANNPDTRHKATQYFKKEFELDYLLATLSKPYVAIMDGATMGGGVGLSAPANFRIATENTLWAMPETNIGYTPDVGATFYLNRLDGEVGTYLALTGTSVKGRHCVELGLATHFVPSQRIPLLLEALEALEFDDGEEHQPGVERQGSPTKDPQQFYKHINEIILQHAQEPDAEETRTPLRGYVRQALDDAFSYATVPKIIAHITALTESKNADVSKWASETLRTLKARSPTSLVVSLEAKRSAELNDAPLRQCLEKELEVAHAYSMGATPDLYEGVTKNLVKELRGTPVWSPDSVEAVEEQELVRRFFDHRHSEYLAGAPTLEFETEGLETLEHDYSEFALPTEKAIESIIRGSDPDSPGLSYTPDELIAMMTKAYGDRPEVALKVADVIQRQCVLFDNGDDELTYLAWKPRKTGQPLLGEDADDALEIPQFTKDLLTEVTRRQ